VSLFPAARSNRTSLRMLGPDGQPLARKYFAENTGKDLDVDEVVRGYEVSKEKYVIVTDEELDRLAPEKTRDIDLKQFVPAESIPPLYFERGYFLTPAAGSQKAYKLLAETMEESKLAGIATFVMRGKEYLVAIFSDKGILRAETMRFADELRSPADIGLPKK
jgi:DNA end-binding protein Ku